MFLPLWPKGHRPRTLEESCPLHHRAAFPSLAYETGAPSLGGFMDVSFSINGTPAGVALSRTGLLPSAEWRDFL